MADEDDDYLPPVSLWDALVPLCVIGGMFAGMAITLLVKGC